MGISQQSLTAHRVSKIEDHLSMILHLYIDAQLSLLFIYPLSGEHVDQTRFTCIRLPNKAWFFNITKGMISIKIIKITKWILEPKKNCKFQEKCILITQILLNKEPIVEYRPSFLNGLAFFQKCQIALEVQGVQHWFHHTS
ncbi:hypothetical protein Glove_152g75 [Diversispora epigaea]|uniref:Uncharacterized protein n=1 Tax=Diversispora epigaea TaxID=1348612 RepID=A0A397ISX3_9GLOM|nr:hypothetical protein Glove_152g75 [Diversispora epigaea]